jgi:hypothetical protein
MCTLPSASRAIFGALLPPVARSSRETPTGAWPNGNTCRGSVRVIARPPASVALQVTAVVPTRSGRVTLCAAGCVCRRAAPSSSRSGDAVGASSLTPGAGSSTASTSGSVISGARGCATAALASVLSRSAAGTVHRIRMLTIEASRGTR